jgi:ribonuclease HI
VERSAEFWPLGTMATVFQAEIDAIARASQYLLSEYDENQDIQNVQILSDSQAAIKALDNPFITSKTTLNCINDLNQLSTKYNVSIRWIKAHKGYEGNEAADRCAKGGALINKITDMVEPCLPVSHCWFRMDLRTRMEEIWAQELHDEPRFRQTKYWFPIVRHQNSRALYNYDRKEFSRAVRYLTGHAFLGYQNNLTNPNTTDSKRCRFCKDENETAHHIITECDRFIQLRTDIFQKHPLDEYPEWNTRQIIAFLRHPTVRRLESDLETR